MRKEILRALCLTSILLYPGWAEAQLDLAISSAQHSAKRAETESIKLLPASGRCGTKIDWLHDHELAFERAEETGKPVFLLHLSGNLKNEAFT